jgi:hypothetical protein
VRHLGRSQHLARNQDLRRVWRLDSVAFLLGNKRIEILREYFEVTGANALVVAVLNTLEKKAAITTARFDFSGLSPVWTHARSCRASSTLADRFQSAIGEAAIRGGSVRSSLPSTGDLPSTGWPRSSRDTTSIT